MGEKKGAPAFLGAFEQDNVHTWYHNDCDRDSGVM